jgi:hypothetical protein
MPNDMLMLVSCGMVRHDSIPMVTIQRGHDDRHCHRCTIIVVGCLVLDAGRSVGMHTNMNMADQLR